MRVELGIPLGVLADEALGAVWCCADLFATGQADLQELIGVIVEGWKLGVDGYLPGHQDHLDHHAAEERRKNKAREVAQANADLNFEGDKDGVGRTILRVAKGIMSARGEPTINGATLRNICAAQKGEAYDAVYGFLVGSGLLRVKTEADEEEGQEGGSLVPVMRGAPVPVPTPVPADGGYGADGVYSDEGRDITVEELMDALDAYFMKEHYLCSDANFMNVWKVAEGQEKGRKERTCAWERGQGQGSGGGQGEGLGPTLVSPTIKTTPPPPQPRRLRHRHLSSRSAPPVHLHRQPGNQRPDQSRPDGPAARRAHHQRPVPPHLQLPEV